MSGEEQIVVVGEQIRPKLQLMSRARQAATGFVELGVGENDAIALLLQNDFAFIEATQAAGAIGAYAVPLNWHASADEVAYMLRDCAPRVLVAHVDLIAAVRHVVPTNVEVLVVPSPGRASPINGKDRMWDDWLAAFPEIDVAPKPPRASWIYTSGTTGHPKGVHRAPASPDQAAAMRDLFQVVYGCHPGMRGFVGGPLYHASPNAFARQGLSLADVLVLSARFDPEKLLRQIESYRLTTLVMVPTFFIRLLKLPEDVRARYDLSSLKLVLHTGAPCPPDVKRAMIDWWGPVIVETYGGSETGVATICTTAEWLQRPGTVGRVVPGGRIKILDDQHRELATGESGEIFARSPAYPDFSYHGRTDDRRAVEVDGLITCGDVGYLDEDGYLFLNDRKRDMIISGGVNIYPAEIEAVLQACPGVQDCAVFGIPDDEFGERIYAAVQPDPGITLAVADIKHFIGQRLAGFKVPREVHFHDALPREESGKIFKRKLREPFWADKSNKI
ncbi:AMP-binding protein [Tardiphaga sp. 367_B4_N1_1]|uniref:AMP-binding protein n=1 Tax=Tardiphaga sp. 367_B4_N1_1 TaxID=3240777 RepID=UPI003F22AC70